MLEGGEMFEGFFNPKCTNSIRRKGDQVLSLLGEGNKVPALLLEVRRTLCRTKSLTNMAFMASYF